MPLRVPDVQVVEWHKRDSRFVKECGIHLSNHGQTDESTKQVKMTNRGIMTHDRLESEYYIVFQTSAGARRPETRSVCSRMEFGGEQNNQPSPELSYPSGIEPRAGSPDVPNQAGDLH